MLIALYNRMTSLTERRAGDVVYLDFIRVFDNVPANIFTDKLRKHGLNKQTSMNTRSCTGEGITPGTRTGQLAGKQL